MTAKHRSRSERVTCALLLLGCLRIEHRLLRRLESLDGVCELSCDSVVTLRLRGLLVVRIELDLPIDSVQRLRRGVVEMGSFIDCLGLGSGREFVEPRPIKLRTAEDLSDLVD